MKQVDAAKVTQTSQQSVKSTWRAAPQDNRRPVSITDSYVEKEKILDKALDEYCELMEEGKAPPPKEFCKQYPDYRHSLCRLIEVEVAMADEPALDEDLEAAWPKPMQQFLDYEIVHELGIGAFARVYLAAEQSLGGRLVAVKVSPYGSDEAKTLAKLTHPNIVPVFSVRREEATDMTAVCMPYHGSTTLADLLEAEFKNEKKPNQGDVIVRVPQERESVDGFVERSLQENEIDRKLQRGSYVDGVARLGIQMADALAYTHERGILHRDLKPSNVLLTPAGVPMLLDFNLASDIESGSGRLGGTLPYMPPEQIQDAHLQPLQSDGPGDPRSDVFSLGVILYELLSGQLPFGDPPATMSPREASTKYLESQQTKPTPIAKLNPQVSPSLARTIHRCLSLDMDRRPKSALQLKKDLKRHFGWLAWLNRYRIAFMLIVLAVMLVATDRLNSSLNQESEYAHHMRAAISALEADDYKAAIELFDTAEEAEGFETVPILFGRGFCNQQLGIKQAALPELDRASDLSNDPFIADYFGFASAVNGEYRTAIISYQKAMRLAPSDDSPSNQAMRNVSIGFCKLRAGSAKFAIGYFTSALEIDPDLRIAYLLRASAGLEAVDPKYYPIDRVVADIHTAIGMGEPFPEVHFDAARIFATAAIDNKNFLEEFVYHLNAAVDAGFGPKILNSKELEPWREHEIFSLAQTRRKSDTAGPNRTPLVAKRSLFKRSQSEVLSWLDDRAAR